MASITGSDLDVGSFDNHTIISYEASQAEFDCSNLGSNTVGLIVSDASGNTSECTSTVTIEDTTNPELETQNITVGLDENGSVTINPEDFIISSYDNCGIIELLVSQDTFDCSNIGSNNVDLTAIDASGNFTAVLARVFIEDNVEPTISCPQSVVVNISPGQILALVGYPVPEGTDNCSGVMTTMVSGQESGTFFPLGLTEVTYEAVDASGNTSSCSFDVVIDDGTQTIAVCNDLSVSLDETGTVSILSSDIDGGSVGFDEITLDQTDFDCSHVGENALLLTVSAISGETSTCTSVITIVDDIDPVIPELLDITAECEATVTPPIASDLCAGDITATTESPMVYSSQGAHTITWVFDDGNGNVVLADQQVIIDDTTDPDDTVCADLDFTIVAEEYLMEAPVTSDNCSGIITSTTTDAIYFNTTGDYAVTWTFDDGNGNIIQCPATCSFSLPEYPEAMCEDVTLGLDEFGMASLLASDVDAGSTASYGIDTLILSQSSFDCSSVGTHLIELTVVDSLEYISTCTSTITIEDLISPVIPELPDVIGECSATVESPVGIDNCSGEVIGDTSGPTTFTEIGTHVVVWTFTDENGNVTTATQDVIIDGVMVPEVYEANISLGIQLPNGQTVCDYTTSPQWFNSISNQLGLTGELVPISEYGTLQGPSVFLAEYENSCVTMQGVEIQFIVNDLSSPTFDLIPEDMMVTLEPGECEIVVEWESPEASDSCQEVTLTANYSSGDSFSAGQTIVTYVADDGYNQTEQSFIITIIDNEAPVAMESELPTITAECDVTLEAPEASDNCNTTIIGTTEDLTSSFPQGEHTITWVYSDSSGNTTEQIQMVIIEDITPPSLIISELMDIIVTEPLTELMEPEVTDNCSGEILITNNALLPIEIPGTHIITWTFTDAAGNSMQADQNITIDDSANSIVSIDGIEVTIYPNPSNGEFNIETSEVANITVINVLGRLVYKETLDLGENKLLLTHLPSGTYIIELASATGSTIKRITIE